MSGRREPHHRPAGRPDRQPVPAEGAPDSLAPGATVLVVNGKPWKRTITMRGTVQSWDGELLVLERLFSAGGQYDSLYVPKLRGDWGTIEVVPNGRVLRRAYFRQSGALVGELFNIQTPAEISDGMVRYVDLEVDVVRMPDGRVEVVDQADLAHAVRIGGIDRATADAALALAERLAGILRDGGDWRTADAESA